MAHLYKGQPAGSHVDGSFAHSELDAEIFNQIELRSSEDNDLILKLIAYVQSRDAAIQFVDNVDDLINESIGVVGGTDIAIAVTDSTGAIDTFSTVSQVTVEIDSDTTGGALIEGVTTYVLNLTDGQGSVNLVDGGGAGTVVLRLVDSGGTGLDITDLMTVNYS